MRFPTVLSFLHSVCESVAKDLHRLFVLNNSISKGVMMRLETLIELEFLNSGAFRACPLVEIRQAVPCRAIRGNSISVNSTLPPS